MRKSLPHSSDGQNDSTFRLISFQKLVQPFLHKFLIFGAKMTLYSFKRRLIFIYAQSFILF